MEKGNALIGIVIITLVLIAGGVYFWQKTRLQLAENERARQAFFEQQATVIEGLE